MTNPIPTDWKQVKLGDFGKVSMCKRIFKNQTSTFGNIPFFKIGTFGKKPDAFISKEIHEDYKKRYSFPKKGEILISAAGTIGRAVVYDGSPAYFQDSNIVWLANNEKQVLNSFLVHAYKRIKWQTASGTIARLYNDNIRRIEMCVPPLPEQHRIVAILETWDEALEKLNRKIEIKKQIKKGLMQKLLTGKVRLAGFSGEWETVKLGDIATFKKGKGLPKSELDSNGEYEAIHYGELFTKYNENIETIISKTFSNRNLFLSKKNDILMPTSDVTPKGLSTASCINKGGVVLGGDILIIRSLKKLNGLFFCYVISANKKEVIRLVSGSTVFHLYGSDMVKFKLNLPPIEEQTAIAKILTTADDEITALEKKRDILEAQKKYLLNNLITGKIRTGKLQQTNCNLSLPKI